MAVGDDSKAGRGKKKRPAKKKLDAAGVLAEQLAEVTGDKPKIENWATETDSDAYEKASKLYDKIVKCYENQQSRADDIEEYWSIYNAEPDENQTYMGDSQCYIPATRDAINARVKRTLAQLFPINHKHVEAVGPTGQSPTSVLSLLEHYIRQTKLKEIVRADLISGDTTGQWGLYVDWCKSYRRVTEIVRKPRIKEHVDLEVEIEDETEEEDKIETKEVVTEGPDIVQFAAEDLAVYPPTVDSIESATAVSLKLRMSKEKVQEMIDQGTFVGVDADQMFDETNDSTKDYKVPQKKRTSEAGVKSQGTFKYCLVFEVACDLPFDDPKVKEPALVYFWGQDRIAGIIKSPYWSGRRPIISAPVEKVSGSFYGISKIKPIKFLQWNLNDYWNMGQDSAKYALLPIVMTDPLKTPQYQSMVMGLAAVWLADPNSTKFAEFPPLWKDSMQICQNIKTQIWESLDVNEAMMGKMPQGRKNNQLVGNMQQEQQINIIDHAKRYEECILNPLTERIFELDQQFRTDTLTVETMGEVGVRAMMMPIEPQQFGKTYAFRWVGTSFQMGMQRMQQMIATMNVLRGIPPQQLNGRRFDATPILEYIVEQVYGPELAPRIFIDERNLFTIPPDIENNMLHNGLPTEVHPGDNHQEHIKSHDEAARLTLDTGGLYRTHIMEHMKALQAQMQQRMGQQQQQQGGAPGIPGGGQPGVAGTPRIGAQPGQPRLQGPPGMIPQDNMAGAPGRG